MADSEENLKRILLDFDKTLKQDFNMQITKTKTMNQVCSRKQVDTYVTIDNIKLESSNSFT